MKNNMLGFQRPVTRAGSPQDESHIHNSFTPVQHWDDNNNNL